MPLVMMKDVRPERINWLWPGRIPFGKLTILDGNGGLGKSTIMLDLAARLSRGASLPDGTHHAPMSSLLLMVEDGLGDTIRPRLDNAGADLDRIGALPTITDEEGYETLPTFPEHVAKLAEALALLPEPIGLVVIDPIMSYLAESINAHRDQDVRRALNPLIVLAEQNGAAIVLLRHLNKATGADALYRGQGAMAFINVCRAALVVAHDPDDETRFVLAGAKANLGPPQPALAYRLAGCPNGAARVEWLGASHHTAQTLLAQAPRDDERTVQQEAETFLREVLAQGPVASKDVQQQAREAGIAPITLRRAREALGVRAYKEHGSNGRWSWGLPTASREHDAREQVAHPSNPNNMSNMSMLSNFQQSQEERGGEIGLKEDAHVAHVAHVLGDREMSNFPDGRVPF